MILESGITKDRLGNLIAYSSRCRWLQGSMVEFGVCKGGSLELLSDFHPDRMIYGIDGFRGLPAPCQYDKHSEGDFALTNEEFRALKEVFMSRHNVTIMTGYSPEVFEAFPDDMQFAFVHVDVDLYDSVKHALDYFYPKLLPDGMMLFDDYGFTTTPGAKRAVDEWQDVCKWRGELVFADRGKSGQYLIIK